MNRHAIVNAVPLADRAGDSPIEPWNADPVYYEWERTVDSLKELICLVDENMRVVRINRTIERWRGVEVESVLGRPLHEVAHPRCQPETCHLAVFLNAVTERLRRGEFPLGEWFDAPLNRFLRVEARPVFIHPRSRDRNGLGKTVLVAQDMTEFKQVESRLNQTELELQAILESFPDLYVYADCQGKVLDVKGGKGVGISWPEDKRTIASFFPRPVAGQLEETLSEVCRKGEPRNIDFRYPVAGVEKFFEARFSPLSSRHALMIIRDVTEKLRLESIAEAVVTMNQIGCIFSGIRHEIGNPLNSIKMTLSVLKNSLDHFDRQAVENYILRSLGELAKIEFLLKSLKNFTIYDRMELESFNTDQFFLKFMDLIREDCQTRSIRLEYVNQVRERDFIIDFRAFQQVLLNIIGNAFDALSAVDRPMLTLTASLQGDFVSVVIADNGVGMDDKQLSHIFKPFFTNKKGGSGLGLVIAKKMTVQMNGSIRVQSVKGRGTEVIIMVPLARQR